MTVMLMPLCVYVRPRAFGLLETVPTSGADEGRIIDEGRDGVDEEGSVDEEMRVDMLTPFSPLDCSCDCSRL